MKLRTLIGAGINVSADMAFGIIIMTAAGKAFGLDVPFYFYFAVATPFFGFACLPDADALLKIVRKERIDNHRTITHYPVFMIPAVCLITFLVSLAFGADIIFWTIVAACCLIIHYLHDTIGRDVDSGIKWLAPWNKQPMKFFTWQSGKFQLVRAFSKEELKRPKEDSDIETWAEKYYLRPTRESIFSVTIFIIAVLLAWLW